MEREKKLKKYFASQLEQSPELSATLAFFQAYFAR